MSVTTKAIRILRPDSHHTASYGQFPALLIHIFDPVPSRVVLALIPVVSSATKRILVFSHLYGSYCHCFRRRSKWIVLLLLIELKELISLRSHKGQFSDRKISHKNYGKRARGYSQLPPSRWLYPRCSKIEWRVKGQATTVARGSLVMPIYRLIKYNDLQRWQTALALMPHLEVHGAIDW